MRKILLLLAPALLLVSCGSDKPNPIEGVAEGCKAERFIDSGQFVATVDAGKASNLDEVEKIFCVAEWMMSPATFARFKASTAMSGLQQVTENGLVFDFSYSGSSDTLFLSVQVEA